MCNEFIYGDVMLILARGDAGRLTHILMSFFSFFPRHSGMTCSICPDEAVWYDCDCYLR